MKTYIIDLDGTMYSGSTNIDGAREFIDYLHSKKSSLYIFNKQCNKNKKNKQKNIC